MSVGLWLEAPATDSSVAWVVFLRWDGVFQRVAPETPASQSSEDRPLPLNLSVNDLWLSLYNPWIKYSFIHNLCWGVRSVSQSVFLVGSVALLMNIKFNSYWSRLYFLHLWNEEMELKLFLKILTSILMPFDPSPIF